MSSVNPSSQSSGNGERYPRLFGTGLGGHAYPVLDDQGRQVVENGRPQYVRRGEPGFAEREAISVWMRDPSDSHELSEVVAEARKSLRERRAQSGAVRAARQGVERSR